MTASLEVFDWDGAFREYGGIWWYSKVDYVFFDWHGSMLKSENYISLSLLADIVFDVLVQTP